jgi:hypothetical protein
VPALRSTGTRRFALAAYALLAGGLRAGFVLISGRERERVDSHVEAFIEFDDLYFRQFLWQAYQFLSH